MSEEQQQGPTDQEMRDLVERIGSLSQEEATAQLRALPSGKLIALLPMLTLEQRVIVLPTLPSEEQATAMLALTPEQREELLRALPPDRRLIVLRMMGWLPPDTAEPEESDVAEEQSNTEQPARIPDNLLLPVEVRLTNIENRLSAIEYRLVALESTDKMLMWVCGPTLAMVVGIFGIVIAMALHLLTGKS